MEMTGNEGLDEIKAYLHPTPDERRQMLYGKCILIETFAGTIPSAVVSKCPDKAVITGYVDGRQVETVEVLTPGWPVSPYFARGVFTNRVNDQSEALMQVLADG